MARRQRDRRRWKFFAGSFLIAVLAFTFRDQLADWARYLQDLYENGRLPGPTRPS